MSVEPEPPTPAVPPTSPAAPDPAVDVPPPAGLVEPEHAVDAQQGQAQLEPPPPLPLPCAARLAWLAYQTPEQVEEAYCGKGQLADLLCCATEPPIFCTNNSADTQAYVFTLASESGRAPHIIVVA